MRAIRGRSIQHSRPDAASLIQLCITEADRRDWNCDKCNSRTTLSEAQIRAARAVERSSKAKLGFANSHLCCSATILTDLLILQQEGAAKEAKGVKEVTEVTEAKEEKEEKGMK